MITNPPQQTYLGRRTYARPAARVVSGGEHQLWLVRHLTPRDRWITRMIHEHRVLTTHQIVELGWTTRRSANIRLLELYRWRVLDRFQPLAVSGLAPMHYILDVAGAAVLAYEDGLDPKKIGYQHDRAKGIAHSLRLAHRVAVNGFFTRLVHHARQPDTAGTLTAWWSEERCAQHFGDIVRPDAYGRWIHSGAAVEWFLELDYGTEPLRRLTAKLADYHQLAAATRIATPVLLWTPTARREARIREAMTHALREVDRPELVPVATTAADLTLPDDHLDPTQARWLPLTATRPGRLGLHQLPAVPPHLRPALSGDAAGRRAA
ncbi:replication-relaxation family protein, partial [Frankia tisae]|uniref:replication-relaxation family protein n=1 Tax=Frankia tisae TaxID=2950104 RepID=UPI0021BF5383